MYPQHVLATAAQRLQAALEPPAYPAKFDEDTFLVVPADASLLDAAARGPADPITLEVGEVQLRVRVEKMGMAEVAALAQPPARP